MLYSGSPTDSTAVPPRPTVASSEQTATAAAPALDNGRVALGRRGPTGAGRCTALPLVSAPGRSSWHDRWSSVPVRALAKRPPEEGRAAPMIQFVGDVTWDLAEPLI
ncbi:conserved hypothetical protein [Mycobacterium ulcerans Agy99]|uniref:Uncharacterized protein n=1 Tax=Mycobacterium ulcerans (strain Agy99) TaxID=362242 RepID=A0PM61_MYCUA|nr:conserved hypothetical protein [Mycobacterium ulcerans Agy99]